MTLIEVKDASFSYEGTAAVKELNFSLLQGDYLCIVGQNGSGKSTLLKGLLRLKAPSSGSLSFSEELSMKQVGYMPQEAPNQKDFPASVYEVVLSGRLASLGLKPFYSAKDKRAAASNLELLGITQLANASYRTLSGGQRQRVLLARSLCAAKKLLLLDEPLSGLDAKAAAEFYELLKDINQNMGITIVMVSHDVQSALKYASHILHLENRQVYFGSSSEYQKAVLRSSIEAKANEADS